MKDKLSLAFVTIAGICFVSGLVILKTKRDYILDRLERILSTIDNALSTRKKIHIVGGILMSVSLLFGGLAIIVVSLKTEV